MEIRTARLVLRPWRRGDEDALAAAANHHSVWRNLADYFPHPYTRADAEAWIARLEADHSSNLHLAIVDGAVPVGGIGVRRSFDVSRLTGDLGYWLTPSAWGRGFATEAARALTEHSFREADFQRLEARVLEGNPASCRVLEKAGYVPDARLVRAAVKEGKLMDVWLYSRLRDP